MINLIKYFIKISFYGFKSNKYISVLKVLRIEKLKYLFKKLILVPECGV